MKVSREQLLEIIMRAATVVVVIGYAWLASVSMAPQEPHAASVVSHLRWTEAGWDIPFQRRLSHFMEATAIQKELSSVERELAILGGLTRPVRLTIHSDEPRTYLVADDRIDLGVAIAAGQGQLTKALVKAWLLQKGSEAATATVLRREVISDALLAMLKGDFELGILSAQEASDLHVSKITPWLRYATSFALFCRSPWQSPELQGNCGDSEQVAPQSFRPLLTAVILQVFKNVPTLKRREFIRAWAHSLQDDNERPDWNLEVQPSDLLQWREWVRQELALLLPPKLVTRFALSAALQSALEQASLAPNAELKMDAVIVRADSDLSAPSSRMTAVLVATADQSQAKLWPGGALLKAAALKEVSARFLVWESCEVPTVKEILDSPLPAARVLYVRTCGDKRGKPVYGLAADLGGEGFAQMNRELDFVQVRAPELKLAVEKGAAALSMSLFDIVRIRALPSGPPLLGTQEAKWSRQLKAYRVLGPIEAIEFFRVPAAPKSAEAR